ASFDVTLLDPAAGTLTFPAVAIRTAIDEYIAKYGDGNIHKLIKEHILPHFYAIELMMAPYTVGHLKIGYLLAEIGYEMSDDERFKLYLSNTLEKDSEQIVSGYIAEDINLECQMANKIKHQDPILVIMGNPPYSGASENSNEWTEKLLKTGLDGAQDYYQVDGQPLGEKNPKWLQDDYVKFLRFAQWKIHKAGKGIVGMITNHGYLDNPTFRGMRQSLMHTFDEIYILDLHGNSKKKEKCADGSKDENVFDIQQGTAIVLMVKNDAGLPKKGLPMKGLPISRLAEAAKLPEKEVSDLCGKQEFATPKVCHHELFGLRKAKYDWLDNNTFNTDDYNDVNPTSPFYLFHPEETGNEHYLKWKSIPDIFPVNSVGIVTARDDVAIHDTKNNMKVAISNFSKLDVESAKEIYSLKSDTSINKFKNAQNDLMESGLADEHIKPILYRPFDLRFTYYSGMKNRFIERTRFEVMKHMQFENVCLITNRQTRIEYKHVLIANDMVDLHILETANASAYIFPLYLYPEDDKKENNEEIKEDLSLDFFDSSPRKYNIDSNLINSLKKLWGDRFQPEQLFYYIYAVLYSNIYRQRYAQYLRMDFPRIPFTEDYELFSAMAALGLQLSELHLMTSPLLNTPVAKYQGKGNNDMVTEISFDPIQQTVKINSDKYFEGITPDLWNYHIGGYQVLNKYLKDRKGKTLEDPIHYCRIVTALAKTMEIQREIDVVYKMSIDNYQEKKA
ncbi:MAG: DNA methyltransferase, partial [Candidatus Cloacimonetes bacterium]|nr:DNA methyltransferase [Candidatus Cloacimonadota bacterium]